jgi:EpsI family protein
VAVIWKSKYLRYLTIALLLQATLFYTVSHGDSRLLTQPLNRFPDNVGSWRQITESVVDKDTFDLLRADDVIDRAYVKAPAGDLQKLTPERKEALFPTSVDLFIAYFSTQQKGQTPHSPKNCLPGAGWQQMEAGDVDIPIEGLSAPIRINKYIVAKAESQSLVLYWYQSHGRVVAHEFAAKYYTVADSIRYHRSDTSLIRVVTPIINNDVAGSLDRATEFVKVVYPAVYHFLPM